MEPIFNDDNLMLKLNVTHKLRKVLQREGKGYQSVLQHRVGCGLSGAEFAVCVKLLEVTRFCTVTKGERGATLLTFNDAYKNATILLPEEVIKHAMATEPQ